MVGVQKIQGSFQWQVLKPEALGCQKRRHWPVQVAKKQVLLLNCVHEIVSTLDLQSLSRGAPLLLVHLAKQVQSPHFQVADRCFSLLESAKLMEYSRRHAPEVAKLVCPALLQVARHHWNSQVAATFF